MTACTPMAFRATMRGISPEKLQQSRLTNGKNRPRKPGPGDSRDGEKLTTREGKIPRGRFFPFVNLLCCSFS
ncbi:hypothetical protein, partial [Mesorhizobium sp.]|uniref:hypothetical protein n=1 Tax=Mesorhizobium sp. TaxID=1871066 RepID=UPI0025C345E9